MAVSPVERRGREEPGTRRQMGKGGRIQAVGGRPVPTRIREHSKIITRAEPAAWSSGIRTINPPTVPHHLFLTILYAPFIQPTTVRQSSSRFTQIKFHEFPEQGIRIQARASLFYRHAASHDDFPWRNSSCRRSWSFFKMLTYVHVVVVDNGKRTFCDALTRSSLSRISASGRGKMVSDVSVLAEVPADSLGQSHRSSKTDRRL